MRILNSIKGDKVVDYLAEIFIHVIHLQFNQYEQSDQFRFHMSEWSLRDKAHWLRLLSNKVWYVSKSFLSAPSEVGVNVDIFNF